MEGGSAMIHYHSNGNETVKYEDLAREYLKKLSKKENGKYHKDSPFAGIEAAISDPKLGNGKKAFLQEFADNDFKFLKEVILTSANELLNRIQEIDDLSNTHVKYRLSDRSKKASNWRKKLETIWGYSSTNFNALVGKDWWFKSLDIPVCPYCNIQLLPKVKRKNSKDEMTLMDLDHFYPKSKYPCLSMSFFNLVPSCIICNQRLKGSEDLVKNPIIHPFEDSFDDLIEFSLHPKVVPDDSAYIVLKPKGSAAVLHQTADGTVKLFRLPDLYQYFNTDMKRFLEYYLQHKDQRSKYGDANLPGGIPNVDNWEEKFFELWEVPSNQHEIRKYSLGKLKRDIIQQA
jgi:hypothetical protein